MLVCVCIGGGGVSWQRLGHSCPCPASYNFSRSEEPGPWALISDPLTRGREVGPFSLQRVWGEFWRQSWHLRGWRGGGKKATRSRTSLLHLDSTQFCLGLALPWFGGKRQQTERPGLCCWPCQTPRNSFWDGALGSDCLCLQPGFVLAWPWAFTSVSICEVGGLVIVPSFQGRLVCTWSTSEWLVNISY